MGDARRFDLFSKLVAKHISATANIVDVASGKGYLQSALRQLGFSRITSWDKRRRNAKNRHGYRYGYFDWRSAPRGYDAVVAMHPDEGTDHAILYAAKERIPFVVCPCCIKPSAEPLWGKHDFASWNAHLAALATTRKMRVVEERLPMAGRNVVLIGVPQALPAFAAYRANL